MPSALLCPQPLPTSPYSHPRSTPHGYTSPPSPPSSSFPCVWSNDHVPAARPRCRQIFKDATLFFSRDTPSLAMVIPAMDHIDATLTDQTRAGNSLQPPVAAALRLAKKTLNRYYKLSDLSATYRIAMSKYPRCTAGIRLT